MLTHLNHSIAITSGVARNFQLRGFTPVASPPLSLTPSIRHSKVSFFLYRSLHYRLINNIFVYLLLYSPKLYGIP